MTDTHSCSAGIHIIENILNLKGFDTTNKDENAVTLLIDDSYDNKDMLQGAAEKLNGMYLRDEQYRLVSVKIMHPHLSSPVKGEENA